MVPNVPFDLSLAPAPRSATFSFGELRASRLAPGWGAPTVPTAATKVARVPFRAAAAAAATDAKTALWGTRFGVWPTVALGSCILADGSAIALLPLIIKGAKVSGWASIWRLFLLRSPQHALKSAKQLVKTCHRGIIFEKRTRPAGKGKSTPKIDSVAERMPRITSSGIADLKALFERKGWSELPRDDDLQSDSSVKGIIDEHQLARSQIINQFGRWQQARWQSEQASLEVTAGKRKLPVTDCSSSQESFTASSEGQSSSKRSKFVDRIHTHLICPITQELMIDPVLAEDGNTYERKAIEAWIRSKGTSPLVPDQRLDIKNVFVNRSVLATTVELVDSGDCDPELCSSWKEAKKKVDLVLANQHYAQGRVLEAAKLGLPKAQGVMASRYHLGIAGIEKDPVQSFFWSQKAAEAGDDQGRFCLAHAFKHGEGTAVSIPKALDWYKKIAASPENSRYAKACHNIGEIYSHGEGHDQVEAAAWYRKGAEHGSAKSQYALGRLLITGKGVLKDDAEARKWFRLSAAQEHPKAMFELGRMTVKGEGGPDDVKAGIDLVSSAARHGHGPAAEALQRIKDNF